jgi:hypothetical protein
VVNKEHKMSNATPGHDRRITIKIKTDKNDRRRATYWSMRTMRWLPLPIDNADLLLVTEQADAWRPWSAEAA